MMGLGSFFIPSANDQQEKDDGSWVIRGRYDAQFAKVLTRDALQFVADLQREFRGRIKYAMECRRDAKRRYNAGRARPVPPAVADRRVEITGPVERKMIINALNSGAKVFVASEFYVFTSCIRSSHTSDISNSYRRILMNLLMREFESDLLIRTCHRRGVHAMGGMVAQIPIVDDPVANAAALELVRKDKLREVRAAHDGTWAAHPGLNPARVEVFTNQMGNAPRQIESVKREDATSITEEDLLQRPRGVRTMEGLRLNTRVGIQYLAAWLTGTGSVPLYNLMEDAATAEISRVQNWQWLKYGVELDGEGVGVRVRVSLDLFGRVVEEELARIEREFGKDEFMNGIHKAMHGAGVGRFPDA